MVILDLNCDLGEGCGQDEALMPLISSANIACGGHAGDHASMVETVALALHHGVAIGAHPGYRDPAHFGRRELRMDSPTLKREIQQQIEALREVAEAQGAQLHHVKAHGALYNQSAREPEYAQALIEAVLAVEPRLKLYALAGSPLVAHARQADLEVVEEVFADRRYRPDGALVPRVCADALIEQADQAIAQVRQMVLRRQVVASDGSLVPIQADTLCLHGDGAQALPFAQNIREWMQHQRVELRAP
ncbi:5-oxoprolinase subunit PxpA [Ferrimonas marina]|uniref:UPF0271 protein n=1 Tax=Ferrimonas marina TaxID=299255 RepID=A0A1M5RKK9_9GAMM|nr:5-oxoprolinase subunit PxpA [Ferrimonas marina]SHH26751.1 UPF0271 protein [Ferrimonas marina]